MKLCEEHGEDGFSFSLYPWAQAVPYKECTWKNRDKQEKVTEIGEGGKKERGGGGMKRGIEGERWKREI